MKNGRRLRPARPSPTSRPSDAGGQDQPHRPRLAQRQDAARLGAGLQRPGGHAPRIRSSSPPRCTSPRPDFGQLEPMVAAAAPRARARRRRQTRPRSCSPTPATGTRSRWSGSPRDGMHGARSRPTPTSARARGRAGTAGSTRSCAASWPPTSGGALYAKRQGMIEPVFADTKFNRRIDRFLRRGRAAAGRNGG